MSNDVDFERELNNRAFALQCNLLIWRLARMYSLPHEEEWKSCFESLSQLRDLLTSLEVFLTDPQEGEHRC